MSNELKVFSNEMFGQVRVILKNDEPLFLSMDIATILEYSKNAKMLERLDEDEKTHLNREEILSHFEGDLEIGNRGAYFITESGLYSAILGSKKSQAKEFKKWVTKDVLPSIRKNGAYMTDVTLEKAISDPDFMIGLLTNLKQEQQKRMELERKVEQDRPLVLFAETALKSKDNILVRELAKIANDNNLNIGEKRLYKKLREWGLILNGKTEPSQRGMNMGLFVVEEKNVDTPYGLKLTSTTKVTPKGQIHIIEKLKQELLN